MTGAVTARRRPPNAMRLRESRVPARPGTSGRGRPCRICERGLPGGERLLQSAWKRLRPGSPVVGRHGESYVVAYPGRPADGGGPDFRDAVLRGPDGTLLRGDVEIHVRDSGWREHRHHLDPRYNGVAFHVTAESESGTSRQGPPVGALSGRRIHFLVLGSSKTEAPEYGAPAPVAWDPGAWTPAGPVTPDMLARAGDQRFLARSSGLAMSLRSEGGDQAVWTAVLDCLGYSRNRRAFRQVARRLPWSLVSDALASGVDARSMMTWGGGFGPRPGGLEPAAHGEIPNASVPEWAHGGRPDNRPQRRLEAAAKFALRWHRAGPINAAVEAVVAASTPGDLISGFRVGGPVTRSKERSRSRALVGEGRAREITVNAVLPVVHAWSLLADRWDVTERALRLYREHPGLPANAITREMASLLREHDPGLKIVGARQQQGLILMYRAMTAGPLYATPPPDD